MFVCVSASAQLSIRTFSSSKTATMADENKTAAEGSSVQAGRNQQRGKGGRGGGRNRKKQGRGQGGGMQTDFWSLAQPGFRQWLSNITTRDEYNKLPIDTRMNLLDRYGRRGDNEELQGMLKRFLASHADPYVAISAAHYSRDDSQSVRTASIAYFGLDDEKFCQVLGAVDPNQVSVINAHVWPRSAAQDLVLFDLQPGNIHDERNVLRLQKDIERAFDGRELTFVQNINDSLVVKVLNPAKLSEELTGTTMTFSDIQGSRLLLPSGKTPFRRLLAHHSMLSHRHARNQGWIEEEDLTQVEVQAAALLAHSVDQEAQNRLKLLWKPT